MKNWWHIWKALSFSDLPAKFHVQEWSGSFRNEAWSTLIDAFLAVFELFVSLIRNLAIKHMLFITENESPKLYWTYRENRRSKASFVLEISPGVYSTVLHFSGAQNPKLGCRLTSDQKLWYFPWTDFLDFWQEVRNHIPENGSTAGFLMWTPISSKLAKTSLKSWFFEILRKTTL